MHSTHRHVEWSAQQNQHWLFRRNWHGKWSMQSVWWWVASTITNNAKKQVSDVDIDEHVLDTRSNFTGSWDPATKNFQQVSTKYCKTVCALCQKLTQQYCWCDRKVLMCRNCFADNKQWWHNHLWNLLISSRRERGVLHLTIIVTFDIHTQFLPFFLHCAFLLPQGALNKYFWSKIDLRKVVIFLSTYTY